MLIHFGKYSHQLKEQTRNHYLYSTALYTTKQKKLNLVSELFKISGLKIIVEFNIAACRFFIYKMMYFHLNSHSLMFPQSSHSRQQLVRFKAQLNLILMSLFTELLALLKPLDVCKSILSLKWTTNSDKVLLQQCLDFLVLYCLGRCIQLNKL